MSQPTPSQPTPSQLTPLKIEAIKKGSFAAGKSPFPVLAGGDQGAGAQSLPPVSAAQITGADSQRMNQLEKMLKDAQGQAAAVEREAYDKAYAAGEKAGLALGEKRAEQVVEALEEVLKQAESEVALMRQNCVDAVMDIAQIVTEQVIGEVVEQQKEALFNAATRAAAQLPEILKLKLAVHPEDLQSFTRLLKDEGSDWRLCSDAAIAQGTCRLVSKDQDVLIDPVQAVADTIQHIRVMLHSGSVHAESEGAKSAKEIEDSDIT